MKHADITKTLERKKPLNEFNFEDPRLLTIQQNSFRFSIAFSIGAISRESFTIRGHGRAT